ncbi:MAG: amino acid permease [Candidatus Micrarchaeia archaeon]
MQDYKREILGAETDKKLSKKLTTMDLFFLAVGGMIGSSWLFASSAAALYAGPAAILSWAITGVLVFFLLLTWGEVASSLPKSGGIVRYSSYTHGPFVSFAMSLTYTLAGIVVPTLEAEAIVTYLGEYIPGLYHGTVLSSKGLVIAAMMVFLMFIINYLSIDALRRVNTGLGWWKIIIPALTFIFLLAFSFHSSNYGVFGSNLSFDPYGPAMIFYVIPASGIIFAYEGFRQAFEFSGEARMPQKSVLKASILALIFVIFIYTFLQFSFIGAVNWSYAGVTPGNWAGLAGTSFYNTPFFTALTVSRIPLLGAFAIFLLIDAWVSPFGTGTVYFGNVIRDLYGMSAMNLLPKSLLRLNKYKIPMVGAFITLVASILFLLPFPSWYLLIGFASSVGVLNYAMGGISLPVLRKYAPYLKRPFILPYPKIIMPIGFVTAILIVYWSGFTTLWAIVSSVFLSLPILYFSYIVETQLLKSKRISYSIGTAQFVVALIAAIFAYFYLISPSVTYSTRVTIEFFAIYFIVTVLGSSVPLFFTYKYVNRSDPNNVKKITSFVWLLVLIYIMVIISFFGAFGKVVYIPFPWDTIAMIAASLPLFYVAIRSGYETDHLKALKENMEIEGLLQTAK